MAHINIAGKKIKREKVGMLCTAHKHWNYTMSMKSANKRIIFCTCVGSAIERFSIIFCRCIWEKKKKNSQKNNILLWHRKDANGTKQSIE